MIRVVVADDQALVRAGVRMMLEAAGDVAVCGEAADGNDAVRVVERERPDVVLMDLRMPRVDGLEATRRILAAHPSARVVVLTTFAEDENVYAALRAGAMGFLVKDDPPDRMVDAVRRAAHGEQLLRPRCCAAWWPGRWPPRTSAPPERPSFLTDREIQVLTLVGTGLSNQEIAAAAARRGDDGEDPRRGARWRNCGCATARRSRWSPTGWVWSAPTSVRPTCRVGVVTTGEDRIWTIPNLLSFLRLLGVPVFLWLVLGPKADGWAIALLMVAGFSRLARRQARPRVEPDEQTGPLHRPGRRPPLHPGHPRGPGAARHHPVVAGRARDRPRRPAAVHGAVPAPHGLRLRAAGPLPGQGRDRQS